MGRLLLRGPVATGILDPYAPAVLPFRPTNPPRGRFPLLKIYEPTLNGVVRATSRRTHYFVVLSRHVNRKTRHVKEIIAYVFRFPPRRISRRILSDLSRVRTSDYVALIKRVRREKCVKRCVMWIIEDFKVRLFSIC